MNDLADCLAGLDPATQAKMARDRSPCASTLELVQALERVPLGEWAELHVLDELTHRGPEPVDAITRALLAHPLARAASSLCEALVQLYQREPTVRSRVTAVLIDAVNAALDADGGSRGAAPAIQSLADCATIEGPLPNAAPVARRLLAIAAAEERPYIPSTGAAQRLVSQALSVTEPE